MVGGGALDAPHKNNAPTVCLARFLIRTVVYSPRVSEKYRKYGTSKAPSPTTWREGEPLSYIAKQQFTSPS